MSLTFRTTAAGCFINAPIRQLQGDLLPLLLKHRLQPEIGLEGDALYTLGDQVFTDLARTLRDEGLSCTLHAPFFDLSPGALDARILAVSREKLRRAFALIAMFKPRAIICHLNYESNKHGYKQDEWFAAALETFSELLTVAAQAQTIMALENTYETEPRQHIRMMQALNSPYARICLDVGHLMAFAKCPWQTWTEALPWVGHLHLHDNQGDTDTHQAIGRGRFDFPGFLQAVADHGIQPGVTLEPHSEDDLWESLNALARLGVVDLRVTKA